MREIVNEAAPALPILRAAAQTYEERRAVYGPSERKFGAVMHALTEGADFSLGSVDDFIRLGLLVQMVSKLCRYMHDFPTGHEDSVHDLGVYSFMLEAEDARIRREREARARATQERMDT